MATCPQCGRESTGRFCGGCGAPLPAPGAQPALSGQQGQAYGGAAAPPWQQGAFHGSGGPPGAGFVPPPGDQQGAAGNGPVPPGRQAGPPDMFSPASERVSWIERVFRGRPYRYPSAFVWIGRSFARNPRGPLMAFFVAWFNVIPALMLAGVGGVVGAIYGYLRGFTGGSSFVREVPIVGPYITNAGLNIGGAGGAAVGLLIGVVAGFLLVVVGPILYQYEQDPLRAIGWVAGQIISGFVIGLGYTVLHNMFEGTIMRWKGARQPSRREDEFLMPIVREMAARLRMRGIPRVLVNDTRDVNAYAGARHIVINQGLLDEFEYDREVVAGVVAHELTHWHNADAVSNAFVRGVALPVYLPYVFLQWFRKLLGPILGPIFLLVFGWLIWPYYFAMRVMIAPAHASDTRPAEIVADRGAVDAGQRIGMRRALVRIRRAIDGGLNGWDEAICRTHPPTEHRLERLEEPGVAYPLPDPDGPAAPGAQAVAAAGLSSLLRD
ncbi:MAG: M48 family metalloprotease [Actinoallomurus sp.]